MVEQIRRHLIEPLRLRVASMVARGVVRSSDDGAKAQTLQVEVLAGELREIEHAQQYGFTSNPDDGSEAVVLRVGGRSDYVLALGVGDRAQRKTGLAKGEVAVYHKSGSSIVMKANGDIEIVPNSGKVKLTGDLEATGDVKAGSVSLKSHKHSVGPTATVSISTTNAVSGSPCSAGSIPVGIGTVTGATAGPS